MPGRLFALNVFLGFLFLTLALFVYLHNRKHWSNRLFGILVFSFVFWSLGVSFAYLTGENYWINLLRARTSFAAASILLFCLLLFSVVFPSGDFPKKAKRILAVFGPACGALTLLSYSPWIVTNIVSVEQRLQLTYGPLHKVFALYIYTSAAYALFILLKKLKMATGLAKLQLRYLLLGVVIAVLGATTTNLLIPLIFSTSRFSGYGPVFVMVMIAMTAHTIIRYRLMDIKVFIGKGVVYVCAIAVAALIFIGLGEMGAYLTPYDIDSIPLGAAVAIALAVAILFQPLKRWIQDSFNRYLYRQTYDYQKIVREASRRLSTILDLQSLLDYLTEFIEKTLKVEMVTVYMRDRSRHAFAPRAFRRPEGWEQEPAGPAFSETSPLVAFLEAKRGALVGDDASRDPRDTRLAAATRELRSLGGDIALPFFQDHEVSGILVVGPKLSGDPCFAEDIDLLSTLAGQAGIAIKNAQLYQEVTLAHESLENILKTMESGVIAVGAGGTVTLSNPAALRMTGLAEDRLHGASLDRLPKALAGPLSTTLRTGAPVLQVETTLRDSAGQVAPVVCSTSPLRSAEGTMHGAVVVWSDLSRLKELEVQKRRAERLAAFGALATGIAHEIKNPLVAIKTFFSLLPERYTDAEFREGFANVAQKEVDRINALVERLRDLTAPSVDRLQPVDLREQIEETLEFVRGQLEQKQARVIRRYEEPLPLVDGNPSQLKQLFLNLVMNSLEAIPQGGEIKVSLRCAEKYGVPYLAVEVSDTGSGIPEPLLERVFDPFVTTKVQGTGLGLAICRGIADSHHALIRARNNRDGRGATITIEFPVSSAVTVAANR